LNTTDQQAVTVKVCMGTSGKASGGEDVLNIFKQLIQLNGIEAQIAEDAATKRSDAGVSAPRTCSSM